MSSLGLTCQTLLVGMLTLPHVSVSAPLSSPDPLSFWQRPAARGQILSFLERVTEPTDNCYRVESARIAAFDLDGTIWPEKPDFMAANFYLFLAEQVLEDTLISRETSETLAKLVTSYLEARSASHLVTLEVKVSSLVDEDVFDRVFEMWLDAPVPEHLGRSPRQLIYGPMHQLLRLFTEHSFRIYVVTGSETRFARRVARSLLDIPAEQVLGDGLEGTDDDATRALSLATSGRRKAAALWARTACRPLFTAGNSDGDLELFDLPWSDVWRSFSSADADICRLKVVIHHDDAEREFSYTEGTSGLRGRCAADPTCLEVSMQKDFLEVFPHVQLIRQVAKPSP